MRGNSATATADSDDDNNNTIATDASGVPKERGRKSKQAPLSQQKKEPGYFASNMIWKTRYPTCGCVVYLHMLSGQVVWKWLVTKARRTLTKIFEKKVII